MQEKETTGENCFVLLGGTTEQKTSSKAMDTAVLDVSSLKDGRYRLGYYQGQDSRDCLATEFPFFTMSSGALHDWSR